MTAKEIVEALPEEMREEAMQTIERMNPFNGVQELDSAVDVMKGNDQLNRIRSKIAQDAVDSYKRKFDEEKLPELRKSMRDDILKEINPTETPEQKRLRELEDQLKERDSRERLYQVKEKLRAKAKEIGFDEDLAERFALMQTDSPEEELATFAERVKSQAQKIAEAEIAQRWPSKQPRVNGSAPGKITAVDDVPKEWSAQDYAKALEKGVINYEGD